MTAEPPPTTVPTGVPALETSSTRPRPEPPELLIITGMSGAGRSRAAAVLEDLNWYVVDNLPAQLLTQFAGMLTHQPGGGVARLAAVVDVRGREFFAGLEHVFDQVRAAAIPYRILFLDASDAVLVQRFEAVRRPHPLQGDGLLLDGIAEERELLRGVRERADVVIDTSDLNVHELAGHVRQAVVGGPPEQLRINVLSFGFKYGLPLDADHVVDMRFIANPYWVTELRHLTGRDAPVRDYVLGRDGARLFLDRYVEALEPVLAGYGQEEKRYATIAVGCTGGKHRSVAVSEALAEELRAKGHRVVVSHRDLGRE